MKNRCYCEISRSTIEHNINAIKNATSSQILGIVKANGYGIGGYELAKALIKEGITILAVATLQEAVELREKAIETDILILGYTDYKDIPLLKKYNLIQSVFSYKHAIQLHPYQIKTHIKIDTGMSRMGIIYQDNDKRIDEILDCLALLKDNVEGIFTHFSVSDSVSPSDLSYTQHQIELFNEVISILEQNQYTIKYKHISNSYGIVNYPNLNYDLVRPGILLLGSHSSHDSYVKNNILIKPVLSWKCRVGLVKNIKKGTSISYGRTYISEKDMKIATITCGYADGYPRALSNKGYVIINDCICRIVGRICMDQMLVDVTNVSVEVGDEVILVGSSATHTILMEDLAMLCDTITNDLFCRISNRVERIYYD